MRSNRKHTSQELETYIQLYLEGLSISTLQSDYGLTTGSSTFRRYILKYREHGLTGIQSCLINNHYSESFKYQVVQEYLEDKVPIGHLTRKYNIPSETTVSNWIIKYTKGEALQAYNPKSEVYTMKSRKTSHDEKMMIVKDYLASGMSYKKTAEKHQVPYNSVYSWVQKYKTHGPDGLIDGRGRRKPDSLQTEEEKLHTEITALKAKNDYLETENAALKKLRQVERELMLSKQGSKRNIKPLKNLKKKDSK